MEGNRVVRRLLACQRELVGFYDPIVCCGEFRLKPGDLCGDFGGTVIEDFPFENDAVAVVAVGRDRFGERITCLIDGQIDHSVPYAFSREDTLLIDFSAFIPHFNRYTEKYLIEERGDGEVWLYDGSSRTRDGVFGLAIKLLPAE